MSSGDIIGCIIIAVIVLLPTEKRISNKKINDKIDNLIQKYEDNIVECDRVIQAYQHTEMMRDVHRGIKQCSKEIIKDLGGLI